ncbi:MOT12-like protein [Mya arenaria]|uniref:MOT12-like protein n=1 Tax=Mya arenaria TaxID=6604 RepID=A0ABY7G4N9_MYAAR|nr:MOT12-like protein [Mya arenaria]
MMIYCITLYMNGVLYLALLDKYGGTDVKASLVGAFAGGLLCFLGPVAGILNNLFSCRFSIVLGGVFTSVGFASSAFVPSLDWVIFTAGVLVGTGYGMSSSGIICSLGFYFKRYQNQALSCAFLVVGVAMFVSAPLGLYLIDKFGLSQAFLILASVQLQMCVVGVICRPSTIEQDVRALKNLLGLFTGWPNAMMTPLSLSFVGITKLSEAYGLAYLFCGIGVSTGPVLIGVVLILGSLSGFGAMCCRTDGHNKPAVYSIDVEGEKLEEEELTVVDNHVTPDRSGLSASGTRIYGHDETCEQGQPLVGEKNEIKSHFS